MTFPYNMSKPENERTETERLWREEEHTLKNFAYDRDQALYEIDLKTDEIRFMKMDFLLSVGWKYEEVAELRGFWAYTKTIGGKVVVCPLDTALMLEEHLTAHGH